MSSPKSSGSGPTERYLQAKIRKRLQADDPGRIIHKMSLFGANGPRGAPDLAIFEHKKDCWFIEVKTAEGKLSRHQALYHKKLRDLGFDVYVIRTMEELEAILG